jgi:chitin synthase
MDSSFVLNPDGVEDDPTGSTPLDVFSIFCVTIYNERASYLKDTIHSIVNAVGFEASLTRAKRAPACICLIVDGCSSADPTTLDWLNGSELLRTGAHHQLEDYDLYTSRLSHQTLVAQVSGRDRPEHHQDTPELIVKVCLKKHNKGKLHSHALFFKEICRSIQPTFCFQIDVGTVLHRESYHRILRQMDKERDLGALAPCIITPSPISASSLFLSTWQHVDFVRQKAVHWPLEVAAGHLSVIPGQFCAFRWVALGQFASDRPDGDAADTSPLEAYVRGLVTDDPLEKLMYLAEDRVIGNEIVLTKNSDWRLGYSLDATATTDPCNSIRELMRQRRRWNNSALACRIWLLGRTLSFLRRPDRTAARKVKFARAMIFHFGMQLVELATPAMTVAVAVALFRSIRSIHSSAQGSVFSLLIAAAGIALVAALVANRFPPRPRLRTLKFMMIAVPALIFSLTLGLFWALILPRAALPLILAPALFRVASLIPVFGTDIVKLVLLDNVYVLANFFIGPLLSIYSMFNIHDVSWGTKGLTSAPESSVFHVRMLKMKALIVSAWVLFNATLIAVAVGVPGFTTPKLNPVFELICAGSCVTAFFSLTTVYVSRLKRASSSMLSKWFPSRALQG